MSRYERVLSHDVDDAQNPPSSIPNSPPPSFHSRASSPQQWQSLQQERQRLQQQQERQQQHRNRPQQNNHVDPTLADAFDTDGDVSSDDEADDRQRLVRRTSSHNNHHGMDGIHTPSSSSATSLRPTPSATTTTSSTTAAARSNRVYGGGIQSDGVFSNIMAKPEAGGVEKEEQPPTYEQAAADAAPPYWETTILAPGLGGPDEVFIDGMPVGSFFSFIWNGMISMSFQIVGFLLTYLLHSTHAAKNGSRAGLGITMIQYGFYMKGTGDGESGGGGSGGGGGGMSAADKPLRTAASATTDLQHRPDPNAHEFDPSTVGTGSGSGGSGGGGSLADLASSEYVAYALMIVGWFILIRAVSDYVKARRHEQLVLQSPDRGLGVAVIAEGENPERVV